MDLRQIAMTSTDRDDIDQINCPRSIQASIKLDNPDRCRAMLVPTNALAGIRLDIISLILPLESTNFSTEPSAFLGVEQQLLLGAVMAPDAVAEGVVVVVGGEGVAADAVLSVTKKEEEEKEKKREGGGRTRGGVIKLPSLVGRGPGGRLSRKQRRGVLALGLVPEQQQQQEEEEEAEKREEREEEEEEQEEEGQEKGGAAPK
ncbi:uncharacterized protein TRIVIDRAFT_219059 [Trichoderma virens Gv29-8]|uniref:Uncharacterized protein n=1 Tax=Hypocrea virens (strain Gv29-8 / FGSC 10586) TaxID=413071 RepID=G9MIG6_HYPVG|nr:uncharacterized protein TRIVIDRAFT_219059 [Trichoderma virens Gv29-8]EHK25283.1 hypothetical protein TRIVIDRAFT_219059 [Trichoderma virens Gv29-8]